MAGDDRALPNAALTAALAQVADGVVVADAAGVVTYANAAARRIYGAALGAAAAASGARPLDDPVLARALRGERVGAERWRVRRADGSEVAAQGAATPLHDEAGGVRGAVLTVRDVTEQLAVEADRELSLAVERAGRSESETALRRLRAVQLVTDAALAAFRLDELLHALADRVREALEADTAAVLLLADDERHLAVAASAGLEEEVMKQVWVPVGRGVAGRVAATGESVLVEDLSTAEVFSPLLREGVRSLAAVPLRTDGRTLGVLHVGRRDVRRFGEDERALLELVADRIASAVERARLFEAAERARVDAERARAEADAANRAKSQFLAVMSHELRTPLNAVLGYSELIELGIAGPVTEVQRDYLARVRASAAHLLRLINDVLDVSKVEAGRMAVVTAAVPLRRVVRDALQLVRPQAVARHLAVVERAEGGDGAGTLQRGEPAVLADEVRVRQIAANLLSNAVKFTPAGGRIAVAYGAAERPSPDQAAGVARWGYLRVTDTGIGIPAEKLVALFEPFVQVEASLTRTRSGTGLGLAISRRLARLMGGEITVESVPDEGSTFTLWLPLAPAGADVDGRGAAAVPAMPRAVRCELGRLLAAHVPEVVAVHADRLRADPHVLGARELAQADLEDHVSSFLSDFAQTLTILDDAESDRTQLIRDGSALQELIALRHGAQRRRLGWERAALERELTVFAEEVERVVRQAAGDAHGGDAAHGSLDDQLALLRAFLREAAAVSLRGFDDEGNG
jgi:PAS domain S-box-containing protein